MSVINTKIVNYSANCRMECCQQNNCMDEQDFKMEDHTKSFFVDSKKLLQNHLVDFHTFNEIILGRSDPNVGSRAPNPDSVETKVSEWWKIMNW